MTFLARKQLHQRRLLPIFSDTDPKQCALEVGDLWLHTPTAWNACININKCPTSAMLIKLATDREEQLLASLATTSNSIAKLVWQEMQRLATQSIGSCCQFPSHTAEVEEEEESAEKPSLSVESKGPADKSLHKAPGNYPYPFAPNCSKTPPPWPCRNCGSNLHYDRDCDSWRKRDKKDNRKCQLMQPTLHTKKLISRCYKEMRNRAVYTVIRIMLQWTLSWLWDLISSNAYLPWGRRV